MRCKSIIATLVLLFADCAGHATRTPYEDVYKGTVTDGDFSGDPFTLKFVVNLDPDAPNLYTDQDSIIGSGYINSANIMTAYFDVDGHTYGISGNAFGDSGRDVYEPGVYNDVGDTVGGADGSSVFATVGSYDHLILKSKILGSPATYNVPAVLNPDDDSAIGHISKYGPSDNYDSWLGVASFSSGPVSAVGALPELSTWVMMVLGFGIAGWALRSNRGRTGIIKPGYQALALKALPERFLD